MPESRDRLLRPDSPALFFVPRRLVGGILADNEAERGSYGSPSRFNNGDGRNLFGSPFRWSPTALTPSRGFGMERVGTVTPRLGYGRGRNVYRSPSVGRENTPTGSGRRGRGRPGGSVLPSWYPRTPLRDITAVVRAIERRNTRLIEAERHRLAIPSPQELNVLDPTLPVSDAPLEHDDISLITPNPRVSVKTCPPSVGHLQRVLLGIDNQAAAESDFLTPQKKLLNSIDQVQKIVLEEFQKMKRTPEAKKAEREKKVRTLMSMR